MIQLATVSMDDGRVLGTMLKPAFDSGLLSLQYDFGDELILVCHPPKVTRAPRAAKKK